MLQSKAGPGEGVTLVTALIVPEEEAEDPRERIQLGPIAVAGGLRNLGIGVELVNLNAISSRHQARSILLDQAGFVEEAARDIVGRGNRIIGFGSICSSYRLTLRLIGRVRMLMPEAILFLGGPQASATDTATMASISVVDAVLRGEADFSICAFVRAASGDLPWREVPGLTWRDAGGQVVRNEIGPLVELDDLPMPAYDLYPDASYRGGIAIDAGRGCPFACIFCSTNEFFRRRFRMKSPARLTDELNALNRRYGATAFSMTHDLFTTNPKVVREICESFRRRVEFDGLEWTASARIDSMKDGLAAEMAQAGCRNLFFGVETGSQAMQQSIQKRLTVDRILPVVSDCSALGIETTLSLIIGYPEEKEEDLNQSIQLVVNSLRVPHTKVQMHLLVPLPGTPLAVQNCERLVYSDLASNIATSGGSEISEGERKFITGHPDIFTQHFYVPNRSFERVILYHVAQVTFYMAHSWRHSTLLIERLLGGFKRFAWDWARHCQGTLTVPEYLMDSYYRSGRFDEDLVDFLSQRVAAAGTEVQVAFEAAIRFEALIKELAQADPDAAPADRIPVANEFDLAQAWTLNNVVRVASFDLDLHDLIVQAKSHAAFDARAGGASFSYLFYRAGQGNIQYFEIHPALARILSQLDGRTALIEIVEREKEIEGDVSGLLVMLALLRENGFVCGPTRHIGVNRVEPVAA